jgi:transketolase subunit A
VISSGHPQKKGYALKQEEIESLEQTALECRRDIVRMVHHAGSGHPAGSLSAIDVLVVLYMKYMRVRTNEPHWHGRDMFFLSKGHCTPAYYAAMSARGFFPREELMTFRDMHTRLQGHPSNLHLDCVDASSGSLGQGLSVANGAALAAKHDGMDSRYYVMLGDGEIQEGQVWEAAMSAAAFGLDNVCAILDYNKIQLDGPVNEVLSIGDVRAKWEAFGWNAIEINGHDIAAIDAAFESAMRFKGKPSIIIAHTIKGKGVSFMENTAKFHGLAPTDEELAQALEELK